VVNFDQLNSTQFEELCFELLVALGFTDVDWRKGTGKDASPADQGRDIEATYTVTEPDGSIRFEKWFVEVKHHKSGVSPTDLHGAVAWAHSASPDCLLIVCSYFLSNPTKEYLKGCGNQHYRIKYWENKILEELLQTKPVLLDKFGIDAESSVLEHVHQNHLSFALGTHLLEFDDFLQAISELKPGDRDALFHHVYHEVIHPEYRPEDGKTMAECYHPRVNYENFRNQVWSRDYHCAPHSVHQWVVTALNMACHMGKASNVQAAKLKRDHSWEHLQRLQNHAESDEEKNLVASLLETHDKWHGTDDEIEARINENADRYARACEDLIPNLIIAAEKPISSGTEESRRIADVLRVISDRTNPVEIEP